MILTLGGLLLALLMLTPIVLLEFPQDAVMTSGGNAPRHVGITSLLHKSQEIRTQWKNLVNREKKVWRQELQKDLPRFFSSFTGTRDVNQRVPQHTHAPQPVPDPTLARGVAGLPLDQTPALIGAQRGQVQCNVPVRDELVYWNHPQGTRDLEFQTPFANPTTNDNINKKEQFLSFEPDMGGWNNVRMSLENIVVLAAATGRTLILPPLEPFYLLKDPTRQGRSFASFFDLYDIPQLRVVTMADFLQQHGHDLLGLSPDRLAALEPLAERCIHQQKEKDDCGHLYRHLEDSGYQPPVEDMKQCIIFDLDYLQDRPIPELTQRRITRFCGDERQPFFYSNEWHTHDLVHWQSGGMQYRILNHFYTFLFFTDPIIDNFYKRLVRDYLHYKDDIYCTANKIVDALPASFATFHVRRGDFQYKQTRLDIEEWYENSKDVLIAGETIYIATDDANRTFFEPLTSQHGHPIKFLMDYKDVAGLDRLDSAYYGMVDTVVAAQGRVFVGTWFSTFTGYINRLRGYTGLSMKQSWYSWLARKERMQQWEYPHGNYPAREWQVAWTGIDGDTWIEQETQPQQRQPVAEEKSAEYELEKEAGLGSGDEAPDDEEEEENEKESKPIDRRVPTVTLDELQQDREFANKPLGRGVAGRPMSETPALRGGNRAGVVCDVNVDSLAYWNDPQGARDNDFKSPFAVEGTKYISFAPDRGGWNNVRMSMEIIFIFALATGRTLVLPPDTKLYLLSVSGNRLVLACVRTVCE